MRNIISILILICFFFCVKFSVAQNKEIENIFDKAITDISCETAKFMINHTEEPKQKVFECDGNFSSLLDSLETTYPDVSKIIKKSKKGFFVKGADINADSETINKIIDLQIAEISNLYKSKSNDIDISELKKKLLEILNNAKKQAETKIKETESIKETEKTNVSENTNKSNASKSTPTVNNERDYAKTFLIFLVIVLFVAIAFLYLQNKKLKKSVLSLKMTNLNPNNQNVNTTNIQNTTNVATQTQPVSNQNISKSNTNLFNNANKSWFVVGESVIGLGHIKSNPQIPCQDNHHYEIIGNNWGIAITADGAGSAKLSQKGSEFVTKFAALKLFKDLVISNNWHTQNILPSDEVWKKLAKEQLMNLRVALDVHAKKLNVNIKDLHCTVIVVIYSPNGILVTHIGDGRAGYCNDKNEWKSMITPWKGEESNETVFITSDFWNKDLDSYIESRIIREQITAFTLMSDGCEKASFECSKIDSVTQKWSDPNLPFNKFFNPLVETLIEFKKDNVSSIEAKANWKKFLESGNKSLAEEQDDKTIILGVFA